MKNLFAKPNNPPKQGHQQAAYQAAVAPQAVEIREDHLLFAEAALLPLTLRGAGTPGLPERPWTKLAVRDFFQG